MQTQYEWLFVNMSVTNRTVNEFDFNQLMVVYTVSIFGNRNTEHMKAVLLPITLVFV